MKKIIALSLLSLFLGGCFFFSGGPKIVFNTEKGKVEYKFESATSSAEREKGLMFRTSLAGKTGMLFFFEFPTKLIFWMKNTLIPLDMIFMDGDYRVLNIAKNVQPCKVKDCPLYYSSGKAQYVLEVNAGESDRYFIKPGVKADLIK